MKYVIEAYKLVNGNLVQWDIKQIFPHLNHVYLYLKQLKSDLQFSENGVYYITDTFYVAKPYFEYPDDKFIDKKGREWEMFTDVSYYDMICVRMVGDNTFNSKGSYHFSTLLDAKTFAYFLKIAD